MPDGGSTYFVIILLTVRSVADVIVGCFCDSAVNMSDRFAFRRSWASTYYVVAFGVSRLSVSVFVYMLVAVSALHVISPEDVMVPKVTTFPVAASTVNLATIGLLYPTVNPVFNSRPCDM